PRPTKVSMKDQSVERERRADLFRFRTYAAPAIRAEENSRQQRASPQVLARHEAVPFNSGTYKRGCRIPRVACREYDRILPSRESCRHEYARSESRVTFCRTQIQMPLDAVSVIRPQVETRRIQRLCTAAGVTTFLLAGKNVCRVVQNPPPSERKTRRSCRPRRPPNRSATSDRLPYCIQSTAAPNTETLVPDRQKNRGSPASR